MVLPLHLQLIHEKYYAGTTEYLSPVSVNAEFDYNSFKFNYTIDIRPVCDVEFQSTGV